jgi:hypothetical protein
MSSMARYVGLAVVAALFFTDVDMGEVSAGLALITAFVACLWPRAIRHDKGRPESS